MVPTTHVDDAVVAPAAVGSTLSVSCTRPTTGLWAPFSLNLTGLTAPDSCGSTASVTAVTPVSVAQQASLTRTSQNAATCPTESTTTATFLVNSAVAGASFSIVPRAGTLACSASPSTAGEDCACSWAVEQGSDLFLKPAAWLGLMHQQSPNALRTHALPTTAK